MSDLREEYRTRDVEFVAVNGFEEVELGKKFAGESGLDYTWLYADESTLRELKVGMVPAQIILDREGKVTWVSSLGSLLKGVAEIREALEEAAG